MAGWGVQHLPVYRGHSHLLPGTRREENQGPPHRTSRVQRSRGSFSRLGTPRPGGRKGGPQVLGTDALGVGSHSPTPWCGVSGRVPARFAYPWGARKLSVGVRSRSGRAGLWGSLGARPSPHQLAPNLPTPRLSQSSRGRGSSGGAGRTIAAREGGAVCTGPSPRPGGAERAGRRPRLAAYDSRQPTPRRRGGTRGSAGLGVGGVGGAHPPAVAARWRSPAPRPANGGSAAELERGRRRGRFSSLRYCRRRADGRTRGAGGGAAGPAGRGGADWPR